MLSNPAHSMCACIICWSLNVYRIMRYSCPAMASPLTVNSAPCADTNVPVRSHAFLTYTYNLCLLHVRCCAYCMSLWWSLTYPCNTRQGLEFGLVSSFRSDLGVVWSLGEMYAALCGFKRGSYRWWRRQQRPVSFGGERLESFCLTVESWCSGHTLSLNTHKLHTAILYYSITILAPLVVTIMAVVRNSKTVMDLVNHHWLKALIAALTIGSMAPQQRQDNAGEQRNTAGRWESTNSDDLTIQLATLGFMGTKGKSVWFPPPLRG